MHFARRSWRKWTSTYRDPRYVISTFVAFIVLLIVTLQVLKTFDQLSYFDVDFFAAINNWPAWLLLPLYSIAQFGSLSSILIWASLGAYARNIQAGLVVIIAGLSGWLIVKPFKLFIGRDRPGILLDNYRLPSSENFVGLGYPSGHSTVSAACATVLYYYIDPKYRKYLVLLVFLVGLSRIYTGAHFPTDVIGGWALGVIVGSLASLILGTQRKRISIPLIKKRLMSLGINAKTAHRLNVDARGSIPILVEDIKGKSYFVKLFGKPEHTADWLFKVTRYFRFKSFSDEEPYLNSKRNVEHEALAALWANKAGVRTPEIYGYAKTGNYWLLVQDGIDAKPLDKLAANDITDILLKKVWKEVVKLQRSNIAHRDLRPANVMVDNKGRPWIIDFGFAEVSTRPTHKKMDIAELLMATALLVGVERAVAIAKKVLGRRTLLTAAPYVQMAVFSGATTTLARKNRDVYKELRAALTDISDQDKIDDASVQRLRPRVLINTALFAIFLFVVVPQFKVFRGALSSLEDINTIWLLPIFAFSALSYFSSALALVTLNSTPLGIKPTVLVQFASSYASKLLPGGLGPAALMVRYLRKSGLDDTAAASLLVVQRLIDFAMFVLPLGVIIVLQGGSIRSLLKFQPDPIVVISVILTLITVLIVVGAIKKWRRKFTNYVQKTYSDFQDFASSPKELFLTALFSLGVTLCYVGSLYFSLQAVGLDISPVMALVVYATATIAGSASPVPGGLGALEIGMVAALIGLGFHQPSAYASVILYRLATFWAPVPVGFLAYQYVQKKRII